MDFRSSAYRVAFDQEAARRKPKRKLKPVRKPRPVAKPKKPVRNILSQRTEYSCQVDINLTVDFEGNTTKSKIIRVLKNQLAAAIQNGVVTTGRELAVDATNISVRPLNIECAVNDPSSIEDDTGWDL